MTGENKKIIKFDGGGGFIEIDLNQIDGKTFNIKGALDLSSKRGRAICSLIKQGCSPAFSIGFKSKFEGVEE